VFLIVGRLRVTGREWWGSDCDVQYILNVGVGWFWGRGGGR